MASDLPDVLEKLALQAEQSDNTSETSSLSKYFGQPDASDDIFDVISKPSQPSAEEPRINLVISSPPSGSKEGISSLPPSFAFKKGEEDSEPKVFSYFSQPSTRNTTNKNEDATEFFDHISDFTKPHEPKEVSNLQPNPQSTNMFSNQAERLDSDNVPPEKETASNRGEAVSYSTNITAVLSGAVAAIPQAHQETKTNIPFNAPLVSKIHSRDSTLERAGRWWIPTTAERPRQTCPGLWTSTELASRS